MSSVAVSHTSAKAPEADASAQEFVESVDTRSTYIPQANPLLKRKSTSEDKLFEKRQRPTTVMATAVESKESKDKMETTEPTSPTTALVEGKFRVHSMAEYKSLYARSLRDPDGFWKEMANTFVDWYVPFKRVRHGSLERGDMAWYLDGKLNVCYNCVDRHAERHPDKMAILWEGDHPDSIRRLTYAELLREVCRFANALKRAGVKKGDAVCIYMPMVPELAIAMLACARIGAMHNVVFQGFSSESLCDRMQDCQCRVLVTADEGLRAGKIIPTKSTADKACAKCPFTKHVFVYRHTGSPVPIQQGRDVYWHEAVERERPYCPCSTMDSEDPLYILYTSGSTGRPKGLIHMTGGYLVYAAMTFAYLFDYHESDIFGCVADAGWVTGHTYVVYGPLCMGGSTLMFEGSPLYPDAGRYWSLVERHRLTHFYGSPTAYRALMKYPSEFVTKYDRSTLRVLGSVGEPINPEAWKWFYQVVGEERCWISDTYWQTETGGVVICPFPGCTPMKAGSASLPFFGVEPVLVDPNDGKLITENSKKGVLCFSRAWPGMARTVSGDHMTYMNNYLTMYKGLFYTGDGCYRDQDGYYWITGRMDDVLKVSGHRIGSVEVENALVSDSRVAEAAVVGIPHQIKGHAIFAYVTPKLGINPHRDLATELQMTVRNAMGSFAVPDEILLTPSLPKTRSGKIMRRLLRKIACNDTENLGDLTTVAELGVVETLIKQVAEMRAKAKLRAVATANANAALAAALTTAPKSPATAASSSAVTSGGSPAGLSFTLIASAPVFSPSFPPTGMSSPKLSHGTLASISSSATPHSDTSPATSSTHLLPSPQSSSSALSSGSHTSTSTTTPMQ